MSEGLVPLAGGGEGVVRESQQPLGAGRALLERDERSVLVVQVDALLARGEAAPVDDDRDEGDADEREEAEELTQQSHSGSPDRSSSACAGASGARPQS